MIFINYLLNYMRSLFNKTNRSHFSYDPSVLLGKIAYNKYGGYFVPSSSTNRPAVKKIMQGEIYEPDTIKYVIDNSSDGDIIHAGTFFGDFLPAISKGLSAGNKVWAFEPNYENYRCACITILINSLSNIELKNLGLGDTNAKKKLLTHTEKGLSLGGGSKIINCEETGKVMEIETVTIDSYIPADRKIAVIQLDVEGYEKEVLMGGIQCIKKHKPIIILEDNNNIIEGDWFSTNILSLGYKVAGKVHYNTILKYSQNKN